MATCDDTLNITKRDFGAPIDAEVDGMMIDVDTARTVLFVTNLVPVPALSLPVLGRCREMSSGLCWSTKEVPYRTAIVSAGVTHLPDLISRPSIDIETGAMLPNAQEGRNIARQSLSRPLSKVEYCQAILTMPPPSGGSPL